jgi:UDP-N-acetylmuramyl pentapeptide phosphotransferase/UDP-N-acetylglucosamine-1-phosphate transferase
MSTAGWLEAVGLQALRSLVQRWVVGCAGARALPSLQLLTAPSGVRSDSRQAEPPNGDFANCIDGLAGSLLGFLLWNCSPAKVFMGDVGSTFLCAVFVGLVHRQPAGHSVFQAHRLHLFQRLHQAGWPHARVSLTTIAATAVLAVALVAGGWPWVFGLAVVEVLAGVWLDQRVAVPFAVASQS